VPPQSIISIEATCVPPRRRCTSPRVSKFIHPPSVVVYLGGGQQIIMPACLLFVRVCWAQPILVVCHTTTPRGALFLQKRRAPPPFFLFSPPPPEIFWREKRLPKRFFSPPPALPRGVFFSHNFSPPAVLLSPLTAIWGFISFRPLGEVRGAPPPKYSPPPKSFSRARPGAPLTSAQRGSFPTL